MLCKYGCGQEATHYFKNGVWCCSSNQASCPKVREKISKNNGMYRTEIKIKKSKASKGRCIGENNPMKRLEVRQKNKNSLKGKRVGEKNPFYKKQHNDSFKNKQRLRMATGGAAYAQSFIKNPSEEGKKFREIVLEIVPTSKPEFKVLNYSIDIGIEEHKIALEYDGYHHFKDQENINYHNKRQREIEALGWRFIRYNIFQKFPTKEQIKSDLQKLI